LVNTKGLTYSESANKAYAKEAARLKAALNVALKNAPLERQAQVLANAWVRQKQDANPDMDKTQLKKIKYQALEEARTRTGARKERIEISDSEWDAIQAGAISPTMLDKILSNANLDRVRELATPKSKLLMTTAKKQRALSMAAAGFTQAEIADQLGVSLTTLKNSLGE
jgi:DNA-binding NarL/FixJ family response regulator